jgi:hypothetical protein
MTTRLEQNAHLLLDWMIERQSIYVRKELLKFDPPWTVDEIMQKWHFCNVFREQDAVTKWCRQNLFVESASDTELWMRAVIAREFNNPAFLHFLGPMTRKNLDTIQEKVVAWRGMGKILYNGQAYTRFDVPAAGINLTDKLYCILRDEKDLMDAFKSGLEASWAKFMEYNGIGKFISYEIVTDLRHTRLLNNSPDIWTWANVGPGSERGLLRLLKADIHGYIPKDQGVVMMQHLQKFINRADEWVYERVEMRDVEHSLCEFDKYERFRTSTAKSHRLYKHRVLPPQVV